MNPQHAWNGRPIDIAIEQADTRALLGHGDGEIDRGRRFADAALARGDGDDRANTRNTRSAVSTAVTDKTPGTASTAVSQARRSGSLASPSAAATSTAKPTLPSRMTTPETMPSATTSRPLPGSITPVSAAKTSCFVSVAMRNCPSSN
jgi:hypothetical protein